MSSRNILTARYFSTPCFFLPGLLGACGSLIAVQLLLISSSAAMSNRWALEKHRQFAVTTSTSTPEPRRESTRLLQLCEYMSFLYQQPIYETRGWIGADA